MLSPHRLRLKPLDPELGRRLAADLGVSETMGHLLAQRNLVDAAAAHSFLNDEAHHVSSDPMLFRDMAQAVSLLEHSLAEDHLIFIHGDYDVDGVCSTTLLTEGLEALGGRVEHHVPDRFSEGYGVSIQAVQSAAERGARLLLTCDCGSSSHAATEAARAAGMTVIITDHHHLPDTLPHADAHLNPQLPDCSYPFKPMCGTTVAYKLICALHAHRQLACPDHFLDLVAIATIADVMPLLGENRGLVRSGLRRLSLLERPGLRALAQVAQLEDGPWGSFAVGFGLGPRLNAAGRLEHASLAVKLLRAASLEEAQPLALHLDRLNRQRREIESAMRAEVERRLSEQPERWQGGVIVESGQEWHQGVVGITAGRVCERFGVPAFIMGQVGEVCKGSARAAENVHLFEAMQLCSDVFVKFGGHARAAGFTVAADRVDELRSRLTDAVRRVQQGDAPIRIDLEIDLQSANLALATQLQALEPLGEANRSPVFLARRVRLDSLRAMGKTGEHLRCRLVQGELHRKAVGFRLAPERDHILDNHLFYDVAFELEVETWEGQSYPSLKIQGFVEQDPHLNDVLLRRTRWHQEDEPVPFKSHTDTEALASMHQIGPGPGPGTGLPRPSIVESGAPGANQQLVVDGRSVFARRYYLEALRDAGCRPLAVVRDRNHRAKVAEKLGDLATVLAYDELPAAAEYRDVVLLHPPTDREKLEHPALRGARRLHVLFGQSEVRQELHIQSASCLDRPGLEAIWKTIRRHARNNRLDASRLSELEREVQQLRASLDSAVEVFEELQLVERSPQGWTLLAANGRRLEESGRYQELIRRREHLLRFFSAFEARPLQLHPAGA